MVDSIIKSDWMMQRHRALKRMNGTQRKLKVLSHYGRDGKPVCIKCGYSDIKALSIDHINNNGAEHRREIKDTNLYRWLITNHLPPGYQTLCMNCQWIKKLNCYAPPSGEEIRRQYDLCFDNPLMSTVLRVKESIQ